MKYKWHVTSLVKFKEIIESRKKNQFDNIILVTGPRGIGKSTFVGKVLFLFEDFNPYEQIVYKKEMMFNLAKKKNGYIWADEAIISTAKGNTMTRANKMLHELFTISRNNFNIIFLLLPSVEDFDSKILQYCSAWVNIDSRGTAVLLLPANQGIFGRANWDIAGMRKIYDEFMRENRNTTHIPYWIWKNFRGYIKFGKLTNKQEEIVNEIKDLRKNENLDKETKEQIVMEVKEVENYAKYSAKKISELVIKGEIRSIESFNATCMEMKLNPEEIIKKIDSILKHNNFGKTLKQKIKGYEKLDALIKF